MQNPDDLKQEWWNLAPAWIKEAREGRNPTRNGLLDGPMLDACGDVTDMYILDCGCGEGRFCRKLVENGAKHVLGLDLCERMIEAAKELQTGKDIYQVADVQDLHFLEEESFHIAVSYLNQCDLPDWDANNREVFRVLKTGGRFIIANLHPMRSATGNWHKLPDGTKQHVILDNYFDEGERHWEMMGVRFTNYHRSLSTSISAFLEAGFHLEKILEPAVTTENLAVFPELSDELRVPNFILYLLRKP